MNKQSLLQQIKKDTARLERIVTNDILYPKMSVVELADRISECSKLLEELKDNNGNNDCTGRWLQIHLFDDEPFYAKFKCYSNLQEGYGLFYGIFDYNEDNEKVYKPIPLDRCMFLTEEEGRTLEFANGLNATKRSLIEFGAIING